MVYEELRKVAINCWTWTSSLVMFGINGTHFQQATRSSFWCCSSFKIWKGYKFWLASSLNSKVWYVVGLKNEEGNVSWKFQASYVAYNNVYFWYLNWRQNRTFGSIKYPLKIVFFSCLCHPPHSPSLAMFEKIIFLRCRFN